MLAMLKSKGPKGAQDLFLSRKDAVLRKEISRHLDELGWSDFCTEVQRETGDTVLETGNKSHCAGGSETATMTNALRYLCHSMGFGPDYLAGQVLKSDHPFLNFNTDEFEATGWTPGVKSLGGIDRAQAAQAKDPWEQKDSFVGMQVRTCFLDDFVERFVEDHPGANVVLLGAGFDCRLYRLRLDLTGRLFEVDAQGTQQAKIAALATAKLPGPAAARRRRVIFVSCDFGRENWLDKLKEKGLDTGLPTAVVWEGVIMYLEEDAVASNFRTVAER